MERNKPASDFDQLRRAEPDTSNIAKCPKCGLSWLEEVTVKQFDKDKSVILGQKIPVGSANSFIVLRCIKCGEILEPNILHPSRDAVRTAYDRFLDEVEAKLPQD